MSQSSTKSHQSVNSTILTPTLDEVLNRIETTIPSQEINDRAENIEVHDGEIKDLTIECFSLRNLGTNLSDLSLDDDIVNLIETISDQKVERDEKLITKSSKEDVICAQYQLTNDYPLSPEINYDSLKIYTVDPEISDKSRDKLSESVESSEKFIPIDVVEYTANSLSPTLKLKRKKKFSIPLSQPQNIRTRWTDSPETVAISQSEKSRDNEVSHKRSKYDFNMPTSQLFMENSKEPMKSLKRRRSEDNVPVGLLNFTLTRTECPSSDTQPGSSSILPQQSKPGCKISTLLATAISSPKSTDINALIHQPEILTNNSQKCLDMNQSTNTVTQCVRNTVAEPQSGSDKLSFHENVCSVSDDKSLNKVGNSQQITVDGNNLMIKDTNTGDLAMSGKCATSAVGDTSPSIIGEQISSELKENVSMCSEQTKDLPNNGNTNEKNISNSCSSQQFNITQSIDPATNTDLLPGNSTDIHDGETVIAKDIILDEKEIANNPYKLDLTTITGKNHTETVIAPMDIEPAADTTVQKTSDIIKEGTEFDLSFLTRSQLMQIEKDLQTTAEKSMDVSEQFNGKGTDNNDLADWDLSTQFPTASQLAMIESEVTKHDSVTDAAKPSSKKSIDNPKIAASDNESFPSSIFTIAQHQNIDRQINSITIDTSRKSTTSMDCLKRAVLRNNNGDTNEFYRPDIKDKMMNIIENTLSHPSWVQSPVSEPDYEKIKQIMQTRRQQIHKMLQEIRRLSFIIANLKDLPMFEVSSADLNQTSQQNSAHPQPANEFYTTEQNSTNRCTNLQTFTNENQLLNTRISTTETPIAGSSKTYYTADLNKTKCHTSLIFNQASNSIALENVPDIRKEFGDSVTSCKIPNIFGPLKYQANDKKPDPVQSTNVWFNVEETENSNVGNENNQPPQVQILNTSTSVFYNEMNVNSSVNAETCKPNDTTNRNSGHSIFYSSDKK